MDHPFDARRFMLEDGKLPLDQRRCVSIIADLRGTLLDASYHPGEGPPASRLVPLMDELTRRGFDGESLLRYGLSDEIAASVVVHMLRRWFPNIRPRPSLALSQPFLPDLEGDHQGAKAGWEASFFSRIEAALGLTENNLPGEAQLDSAISSAYKLVRAWFISAPMREIVSLSPPEVEQITDLSGELRIEPSVVKEYRWTIERFTITDLRDWSRHSLHFEHQWTAGHRPAPCPEKFMSERSIDRNELNAEIAQRAAHPKWPKDSKERTNRALNAKIHSHAVELVKKDRLNESVALFEFALKHSPKDSQIANNLGFCLIPSDPARALDYLIKASNLGYYDEGINLYNIALCRVTLGQYEQAYRIIDHAWEKVSRTNAILWVLAPNGLRLEEDINTRVAWAELAAHIAAQLGNPADRERWRKIAIAEGAAG